MSYLPASVPAPEPSESSAPFWAWCDRQQLKFQQCEDCGHLVHPPLGVCPQCQSLRRGWTSAPLNGCVFSFTWVHAAAHESVADALPYNVAVIEFSELPGVRLVSNVIDADKTTLRIGLAVTLVWESIDGEHFLPRFAAAGSAATTPAATS
ncbi:hypothetical protein BH10PSE17_BH10PSE17_02970 [soil metagenome]